MLYIYFFTLSHPKDIFSAWGEHEQPFVSFDDGAHGLPALQGASRDLFCKAVPFYRKKITDTAIISLLFAENCVGLPNKVATRDVWGSGAHFIRKDIPSTLPASLVVLNDSTSQEVDNANIYRVIDDLKNKLAVAMRSFPQSVIVLPVVFEPPPTYHSLPRHPLLPAPLPHHRPFSPAPNQLFSPSLLLHLFLLHVAPAHPSVLLPLPRSAAAALQSDASQLREALQTASQPLLVAPPAAIRNTSSAAGGVLETCGKLLLTRKYSPRCHLPPLPAPSSWSPLSPLLSLLSPPPAPLYDVLVTCVGGSGSHFVAQLLARRHALGTVRATIAITTL
eukprot:gene39541-48139_t